VLILSSSSFIEAIIPFVIFAVIFGFKIISAIAKKTKEGGRPYREAEKEEDMWQPESTESSAPPPVPQRAQRAKRAAEKPRRGRGQPEETHPEGISTEAAGSVMANEGRDDKFELAQDSVYDLDTDAAPVASNLAFGLQGSQKRKVAKFRVNLKSKKNIRTAMITREIMARPRCFDI
jgi:hypothetical protein